jgi:hypothetical protein
VISVEPVSNMSGTARPDDDSESGETPMTPMTAVLTTGPSCRAMRRADRSPSTSCRAVVSPSCASTEVAARKGWTVDDACIYVDDGILDAEFTNRPGFVCLMNVLKPRAPFEALVMSEESRLGREAIETAYALKQLVTAGARD